MGDFFQNGSITTLHSFGATNTKQIESELEELSAKNPIALVLPCLYTELKGQALPRIVESLKSINYISKIVVTLGQANEAEFRDALNYFSQLPQKTKVIWNDGPAISDLKTQMREHKLYLGEPGKGLAAWMAYGYVLSDETIKVIALHDCDIVTYSPILLHRLVYPIANPDLDYEFCKGYYSRVTQTLHGRVTRIFVTPMIRALQKMLGHTPFLVYMDSFRYPLAGEFSMKVDLARVNRIPSNWGLEVGTLAEVYRNYANRRVCQVDLDIEYEHKHQDTGIDAPRTGLMRMAREIASTIYQSISIDGVVLSDAFFRSLKATYLRCAQEAIRQYNDVSKINGLVYERHMEDTLAEYFGRALEGAASDFVENPLGAPSIPNWNRVISAMPDILGKLNTIVEEDNTL